MSKGVIYILTNPSFPQYVKIGYATDAKQRLDELNRSTAVPFAFRVYATYEVDSALSDKKLHSILDKLNPELRSTEEVDGKRRIREFYAMTPEDAYSILEAIAEINNYSHRLKNGRLQQPNSVRKHWHRRLTNSIRSVWHRSHSLNAALTWGRRLSFVAQVVFMTVHFAKWLTISMSHIMVKCGH